MTDPVCRVLPVATLGLELAAVADDAVVAGAPRTGHRELAVVGDVAVGIWEHTAGSSTDVEVDEVFVVLSGEATVEVAGGPTLQLGPGDLGVLVAGARTTWHVRTTLRKVYVTRG